MKMAIDKEPTIVYDGRSLKALANAGKIIWPIDTVDGTRLKYCDSIPEVGYNFQHNGAKYQLRHNAGCFMPYVYRML